MERSLAHDGAAPRCEQRKEAAKVGIVHADLFNDLRRGTGAVIISSSSGDEHAYEGEAWKNGVFTYVVIEALSGGKAETNGESAVTVVRSPAADRIRRCGGIMSRESSSSFSAERSASGAFLHRRALVNSAVHSGTRDHPSARTRAANALPKKLPQTRAADSTSSNR